MHGCEVLCVGVGVRVWVYAWEDAIWVCAWEDAAWGRCGHAHSVRLGAWATVGGSGARVGCGWRQAGATACGTAIVLLADSGDMQHG
eukprot:315941-Chlamydomonas_euryale.AAC.1